MATSNFRVQDNFPLFAIDDSDMDWMAAMVKARTKARTAEGICNALNKVIGLPAFEEENIGNMVEYGAITICNDGVIAWEE